MVRIKQRDKIFISIIFGGVMMMGILVLSGFQTGKTLSEINSQVVYVTPPNRTGTQNALDSINSPVGGSPKLLINAQIVLFDSDQKQYPTSTFTNIPFQSLLSLNSQIQIPTQTGTIEVPKITLTDSQGHLLDTGSVQIGLNAVTAYDTQVILTGEFWVYLDGIQVSDKHFTAQGITSNKTLHIDIDAKPVYTFTLADEGATWKDQSNHALTMYVGNIVATIGNDQNSKSYQYSKTSLIYALNMHLDGSHKVVTGLYDNKAVSIFVADNTFTETVENKVICNTSGDGCDSHLATSHEVKIYNNGFLLGHLTGSGVINNIPRNTPITVIIDNNAPITIVTPVTQYSYTMDSKVLTVYKQCSIDASGCYSEFVSGYTTKSNFGYALTTHINGYT